MTETNLPIAVFGATGAQGRPVVEALLEANRPVRAIAHTETRLKELAAPGVETVALDLADATAVQKALEGVAGAFVHLPFIPVAEIIEAQAHAVARAIEAAGVPLTVFTLSGPAAKELTGVASFDTKTTAYRIMQQIKANVIIFQPLGYLGNLSAPFTAPGVVEADELRYPLPASHRQPWISVEDQAALAVAALARPDLAGRTFHIGERLTGPELATGISAGLGRTIQYVALTPAEFAAYVKPFMGEQVSQALEHDYTLLQNNLAWLEVEGDTQHIRRELGIAATPLDEWARKQDWQAAARLFNMAVHS